MSSRDFERREGLYLKFSEPMMEPHTPVIIERVNGNCTVSQFIIARDEAHELINQLCEFLRVGSPRKVGEDGARMHPDRKTPITHEQAREAVAHFVNTHFRNPGQKSRASIPAHQDDDDMLLNDYITQQERLSCSSSVPVGEQKENGQC